MKHTHQAYRRLAPPSAKRRTTSLLIRLTRLAVSVSLCAVVLLHCVAATLAQDKALELAGTQGHVFLQPQKQTVVTSPSQADKASKVPESELKTLSFTPLLPSMFLNQPLNAGQNASAAPLDSLRFQIQKPVALATPTPTPTPEMQEKTKQFLNDGYQALAQQNFPAAVEAFRQATQLEPQNSKLWRELGYALTNLNALPEAVEAFQRVIQLEPASSTARSQLGYLLVKQDRVREAIDAFLAAELLDPLNYSLKLQLGYLYDRVHDKDRARLKFVQASASSDLEIHQKAQDALKALAPVVFSRRGIWTNELYAAPTYYQRFNNLIAPFIFRSGLILSDRTGLEGYFSARATRDTRSSGGNAPQIFEDNFAITSVGLRARPFKNALTLYGEAGLAFNLMPSRLASVKARTDFRTGAYYSRTWGKRTPNDKFAMPFNPVGELYFDVSYYSRFRHNVIGYMQARQGVRVLQVQQTSLETYGRFNLVKDVGRDFFNNLAETGFGAALTPWQKWGFKVTAEYMRGFYLGQFRRGEPNPYASRYGDFRVGVIFGKYIVKE